MINIQEWFGMIPNVHLHGNCAKVIYNSIEKFYLKIQNKKIIFFKSIYELMEKLDSLEHNIRNRNDYKIGHLVLIDRSK